MLSTNLDPHRWAAIQAAFDELVEIDAHARARRLAALGDTDPELRAAVEALLEADNQASARLAALDTALAPAPEPDPLNLSGRTVAHFRVKEALGVGGMGVVYRGEDLRLGRAVALKFLLPHYNFDASAKTRFLREARAAAALDHPHLCPIHDLGETDDGRLFIAMPLYGGETLKARLAREGPLPVADAVAITTQIARGLGCAHGAGIVHRDLKPGNVMVLADGTLKILDFGLAKALDETTSVTSAGFGTVAYMAPEQIRGETVDARADLWALGVVLYEMLTGTKPFTGEQEVAIAHAIVHAEPVPPSVLREGVPGAVEEIVLGLLQKDPSARYAGVEDVLADLATLGALGGPDGGGGLKRPFRTTRRRVAAWQWAASLGAVLAVGGLGGTGMAAWLRPRPSRLMNWYEIPLTEAGGLAPVPVNRIAISPDGGRVVYVGTSPDGGTQLWMRTREQLHATPLAETEGAVNPFFSPDGSRLGFFTARASQRPMIRVISLVAGGIPKTVTDSAVDWGGGAWGQDGYIYFDGRLQGNGIARVPANGGIPEPVTMTDLGESWHDQPQLLPNRKGVLFGISHGGDESESDIGVVNLSTGAHRVLVRGVAPHYTDCGHLVYVTSDGLLIAVPFDQDKLALTGEPVTLAKDVHLGDDGTADLASSATGSLLYASGRSTKSTMQLMWVTRDGKETPIDTTWRASFTTLALSPDGKQLAVGVQKSRAVNIWIKRFDQGAALKLTVGDLDDSPEWTPDGRAVTFLSNSRSRSNEQLDLYRAMADGSTPPELVPHEPGNLSEAEYSHDGKWLLARSAFHLFAVPTDGNTAPIPVATNGFRGATPRLSPNGRWLAYSSAESGQLEVYVRSFPNTGTKWKVSSEGGASPLWSRDGRELFYRNRRSELVVVPVLPGATFVLGKQRVLLSVAGYQSLWTSKDYDVSPDGKRFIMIRSPEKTHDKLIVVENFIDALKPKVKH